MVYTLNEGYELEEYDNNRDVEEDILLLDNINNRIIVINRTCAYVLNVLKEGSTIEEVVEKAALTFEGDVEEMERDIRSIFKVLIEQGIVQKR